MTRDDHADVHAVARALAKAPKRATRRTAKALRALVSRRGGSAILRGSRPFDGGGAGRPGARADGDGDPTTVTIDSPPRETASEARTREETSIERATRRV